MSGSNAPPALAIFSNGIGDVADANLNGFIQGGGVTVPVLRAFPGIGTMNVWLSGTATVSDGGQGMFSWSSTATTADDDGATTIAPNGLLAGRWLRQSGSNVQIQSVSTVVALRALNNAVSPVWLEGYYAAGDGGEGMFNLGPAAADNGGTIIVSADGTYYREKQGQPFSVRWFGAKGDGVTNDSAAFQSAITAAVAAHGAVYVPSTSVNYLINTALDAHDADQLLIYGDGAFPAVARITPTGGSVLAGNTGSGQPIMDALGANALIIRDLTFATIGMSAPSTYGILMGDSTRVTNAPGGSNNVLENVTFLMSNSTVSCPVYAVNCNLAKFLNVNTISDYSLYITNANDLSVVPPFGTFGSNIQSDGIYSYGCNLGGYGSQIPLILKNANSHTWNQLYIVNVNGGTGYTGEVYAMSINNCQDIVAKVEIDYFPSALVVQGTVSDLNLTGIIYHGTTPVAVNQSGVVTFVGLSVNRCNFGIAAVQAFPNDNYWYGTASASPTMNFITSSSFIFDLNISPNTAYFNMTASDPTPLFTLYMNGNSDSPGNSYQVNGSAMSTSGYRIFVNGIKTGAA